MSATEGSAVKTQLEEMRMYELTLDQALEIYLGHEFTPTLSAGVAKEKVVPSRHLSERTDADDGWHLRNVNGWLATVYDDGRVNWSLTDDLDLDLERNRGTRSEVYALNEDMIEHKATPGDTVYAQPPKPTPITIQVWRCESVPREPIKVEVSIGVQDDQ